VALRRIHDAFSVCDLHYRFTHSRYCHVRFRGFHGYRSIGGFVNIGSTGVARTYCVQRIAIIAYCEPVYPEFMPPEDEGGGGDLSADGGDDGDDEDESSDDDEDDDVDIKEDEEEEEHPALADSTSFSLPTVDHAPSAEETEQFETDESAATPLPHPAYQVARLLAIPTPPPYTTVPRSIPKLILRFSSHHTIHLSLSPPPPASPTYPLGYRAAMIRLRAEALSTSYSPLLHIILSYTRADTPPSRTPPLLPIPLPTSSPPLHLLSTNRIADRPEVTLLPQKRLGIALGLRYEVGESLFAPTARPPGGFMADYGFVATMDRKIMRDLERDVGYGITDTWDEIPVDMPGAPATDDTEDRHAHARTARLMEAEARMSREARG
ncbi:hypothetical protein Tco_0135204, partial [Tanacetum coccineum]